MKINHELPYIISTAPGRICLFGDHQDYLSLPIIACAIDRYARLEGRKNDEQTFHISLPDINEFRSIPLNHSLEKIEEGDHFLYVLKAVKNYDCIPTIGYNLTLTSDIPINAGLSSSSAIIVAWVQFLLSTFGCNQKITPELIAQIAYEAEVVLQSGPGGKMDQFSIGLGNILYLETDENAGFQIYNHKINGLIIGESGIPKETIGLLSKLKSKTFLAIDLVRKINPDFSLKQLKLANVDQYTTVLPSDLQPYFLAAVTNHHITQLALTAFDSELIDLKMIGNLMNQHHAVLRDLLKITVPRIDQMINASLSAGAYGAKIVGSGGGGSIVALSPEGREHEIIKAIQNVGAKKAYNVSVGPGARIIL